LIGVGPKFGEAERALHQPGGVLGEVGPARLGDSFHALGQAHRRAYGVEAEILAHPANDCLARVETQTDMQDQAAGVQELIGIAGYGLHQVERGQAGPAGMVLQGDGCTEEGHDAVAGELVDHAAVAADAVRQQADEAVHDPGPLLGVEVGLHVHRPLDVGEEHGELLALALELVRRRRRGG
jgi:hypothetical protein